MPLQNLFSFISDYTNVQKNLSIAGKAPSGLATNVSSEKFPRYFLTQVKPAVHQLTMKTICLQGNCVYSRLSWQFDWWPINMIISKTPLRMSFVGGGSDLPVFYLKFGGAVVSTAINKFVSVTVNQKFDEKIRISYSKTEEARLV